MDMQEPMKEEKKGNVKLKQVADEMMRKEDKVYTKLKINSGSELYENEDIQKEYFTLMHTSIKRFFDYYKFSKEQKKELFDLFEDANFHSLNNYIALEGLYDKKDQINYINYHTKSSRNFLNPANSYSVIDNKDGDFITKQEWNKKQKDSKLKTDDGKYYIMAYNDKIGTYLKEVNVMAEGGETEKGFYRLPIDQVELEAYILKQEIQSFYDKLKHGDDVNMQQLKYIDSLLIEIKNRVKNFKSYEEIKGTKYEYAKGGELESKIQDLLKYLNSFPYNAQSWSRATDELRDIARMARRTYLEVDEKEFPALDFKTLKTPSEWNTEGRFYITDMYFRMSDKAKKEFLDTFEETFYNKMADGGETEKVFELKLKNPNGGMTKRVILSANSKDEASKKALALKEYKDYGYVVYSVNEYKDDIYKGKIQVGDTIRLSKDLPYMASLSNLYNKDLKVDDITEFDFASGRKKYYHITHDGDKYEVNEDFVDDKFKMADGGFVEKTDEELKAMNDDELFAYLDAKAAYMKQYKRPLSAYKAKNFAANATAVQYQKEGTSKLDENFPSIEKINKQAEQDYKEGLKKIVEKKSMADGGEIEDLKQEMESAEKRYDSALTSYLKNKKDNSLKRQAEYAKKSYYEKAKAYYSLMYNFSLLTKILKNNGFESPKYGYSAIAGTKPLLNNSYTWQIDKVQTPNTINVQILDRSFKNGKTFDSLLKELEENGYEFSKEGGTNTQKTIKFEYNKKDVMASGGMTPGRYYKDNSGNEFRFVGESEGKLLFKDGEKIVTKSEEDFEDAPKEKKLFGIFKKGGEVKIKDTYKYIGSESLFTPLRNGRNTTSLKKGDVVKVTRIGIDGKEDDVVVNFDGDAILVSKNKLEDSTKFEKAFGKGGKTSVSPLKDRIIGSKKNKPGSASTKTSAQKIELNDSIVEALSEKAKEYNKKHTNKVTTNALKAVMRRGMGAFSSSHRPGMTRQGWGYARVNKFLLKKGGKKVKATYTQDDDLLENGGQLKKEMRVSDKPKFKKLQQLEDKILHSRNRARNFMDWNEGSIGTNYNIKWQKMIKKLRGWDDNSSTSEQINNTKQEWKEYCKEVGAVENYNFGDVIA